MAFKDKIDTLIRVYRISNITLARGLGLDPSLISRWRTGARVPVKLDRAAGDVAAFLAGLHILPRDQSQLEELTRASCQSKAETERAVFNYLTSSEKEPERRPTPDTVTLTGVFDEFLSRERREPTGPLNLWPHVSRGYPAEHEVFFGGKGRRQAVINFMHAVQSCSRPGDVYLSGWADAGWLENMPDFAELWLRCLQMTLQNGHRLHLLSPPILSPKALSTLLRLPLHHLGSCTLYTAPRQDWTMLMAGRGMGAVISYPGPDEITLFFKAENDSLFFENMISRVFSQGAPLLRVCKDARELFERQLELAKQSGDFYISRSSVGIGYIPRDEVRALLSQTLTPSEVKWRIEALERLDEAQEESLKRDRWIELIPLSNIEEILSGGSCLIRGGGLMLESNAALSGETLRQTLKNLLDRLRRGKRFQVVLYEGWPLALTLMYREGYGALFAAEKPTGGLYGAFLGPSPLLDGLKRWFEDKRGHDALELLGKAAESIAEIK